MPPFSRGEILVSPRSMYLAIREDETTLLLLSLSFLSGCDGVYSIAYVLMINHVSLSRGQGIQHYSLIERICMGTPWGLPSIPLNLGAHAAVALRTTLTVVPSLNSSSFKKL